MGLESGNRVGIELSYRPRQATSAGGMDSLESIPGLLKSLEIPSLQNLCLGNPELVFLNLYGAQESMPRHQFCQPM